ncbi:thiol reductant ABC exporter subunit CydD, partial [Saccharomonospora saliphila]|uniref:thiol reductant ABC exporter subunit CydD n=1 Tax=Saccharomonospora saliphila TaxID=369829 RepID=UPI000365BA9B
AGAKEELRARVVDRALRLGPEWIDDRGAARLTALTTRGLDALDAYFTDYLPALVTAMALPVGIGAAVLVADWPSAVIIAVTLPLLPLFAVLIGTYTADRVGAATDAVHRLSGHLLELVRALPALVAFRRAEAQATAVRRVSDRHRRTTLSTLRLAFSSAFALELAATLSVALVAVVIGVRLVSGDLSLAVGLGVLILAPECYQPIRSVGAAFHASQDGVEAVRRVADVLDEPEPGGGTHVPGRGEIVLSGLRVRRRGGFAPDGLTRTVRPGHTTWLSAPSGAGKSTTLAVLLGFVRPASGTVTVDGVPLDEIDWPAWRESVAWVPQSPAFAGGTVRAELELAAPREHPGVGETTRLDEDVTAVLDRVGLTGFADRSVGGLSAGQRQRVAVARALLRLRRGAWLLLLDEPTAHLDAASARLVWSAVSEAERGGAAVVLAAHARGADDQALVGGGDGGTAGAVGAGRADGESAGSGVRTAGAQRAAGPVAVGAVGTSAVGTSTVGTSGDGTSADSPRAGGDVEAGRTGARTAFARPLPLRSLGDRRLARGVLLGATALLSGIALTATSGWLIARASQQPPILTLTVAVVGVRTFGLARAGLRYLERLATHDGAFRVATRLRERLWQALVRLGPARTHRLRRGEGVRRLVDDVDAVRDLLPRVVTPPLVVAVVALGACAVQAAVLPTAGAAL